MSDTEDYCLCTLAIREQQSGSDHIDTATSLIDLAFFYKTQGKYAKAEPLYQHALSIREQQLGPKHSSTQKARRDYALLLRAMGRYAKARKLEEKS